MTEQTKASVMVDAAEQGLRQHANGLAERIMRYDEDLLFSCGAGEASGDVYAVLKKARADAAKLIAEAIRPELQKRLARSVQALLTEQKW